MEKIRKIEEFLKLIANASANGYLTNSNSVYHNFSQLTSGFTKYWNSN